jgi:hypothetical protein
VNTRNNRTTLKHRLRRGASTAATLLATAAAPATLVVLATQPGCFLFGSPGPSSVGQGHKYVAGNPDYDQYFSQLYDLQVEMAKAPDSEKAIRTKLAKTLGIDADASASMLARKVKKEAEKLEKRGVGLKVTVPEDDDEESPKLEVSGGKLAGDAKTFADAVKDAIEHETKLAAQMKKSRRLLDQLRAQAIPLNANIDTVFRKGGLSKKAEVKKNLKDADSMITLMVARADQVTDTAGDTAKRLTDAITTDHGQFKAPAEPAETGEAKEEEKKKTPHWHPPPHHGGAPPAATKPPPKKPESPPPSDFEP